MFKPEEASQQKAQTVYLWKNIEGQVYSIFGLLFLFQRHPSNKETQRQEGEIEVSYSQ